MYCIFIYFNYCNSSPLPHASTSYDREEGPMKLCHSGVSRGGRMPKTVRKFRFPHFFWILKKKPSCDARMSFRHEMSCNFGTQCKHRCFSHTIHLWRTGNTQCHQPHDPLQWQCVTPCKLCIELCNTSAENDFVQSILFTIEVTLTLLMSRWSCFSARTFRCYSWGSTWGVWIYYYLINSKVWDSCVSTFREITQGRNHASSNNKWVIMSSSLQILTRWETPLTLSQIDEGSLILPSKEIKDKVNKDLLNETVYLEGWCQHVALVMYKLHMLYCMKTIMMTDIILISISIIVIISIIIYLWRGGYSP